jgi:tetratricopeptide (TPR) repeat protein
MYKNKFEKWALGKYNRRGDVEAILRRKAQRDAAGKSTHFFLRGRLVRLADVDRYAKRNKISIDNLQPFEENESDDLKDLICCTPPPASSMLQPERYRDTEKFFHSFFTFTLADLDELETNSARSTVAISQRFNESSRAIFELSNAIYYGATEYQLGELDLAGIYWRKGFSKLYTSVKDFMLELLLATRNLAESGCPEIGVMLRQHASQIADARLGANHPRLLAYSSMAAFGDCDIHTILVLAGKLHRRAIGERYQESSELTWDSRLCVAVLLSRLGDHIVITDFQSLLSDMENQLGKSHNRVLEVLLGFGEALTRMSLYEEAEAVFLDFLERNTKNGTDATNWGFHGLIQLGKVQDKRGNVEAARTTLITALSTFQQSQLEIRYYPIFLAYAYSTLGLIAQETQRGDEAIEWDARWAERNEYLRGSEPAEGTDSGPCI